MCGRKQEHEPAEVSSASSTSRRSIVSLGLVAGALSLGGSANAEGGLISARQEPDGFLTSQRRNGIRIPVLCISDDVD